MKRQHRSQQQVIIDVNEALFPAVMAGFGIAFLQPSEAFALSPNYAALKLLMSETAWGVTLIVYGLIWLALCALTHEKNRARVGVGIFGSFVLAFFSLSMFWANPSTTWGFPLVIIAAGSAFTVIRKLV